jgi:shikimate kinase
MRRLEACVGRLRECCENAVEKSAMSAQDVRITLIGPGGAGKSTIAALLAERLAGTFVDLDQRFGARAGDISEYITCFGYAAYACENVETYRSLMHEGRGEFIVALSSGFMTYPQNIHPEYACLRREIERNPATFVLIPSLDLALSVAETVRRQLGRRFARSAGQEEAVIRERFPLYIGLCSRKIETMRPLTAIVSEIVVAIQDLKSSSRGPGQPVRHAVPATN